ncbi:hypothetical protein MCOR02_008225 [Pyricularia oryzae]|nr:hypothetical protein MCOR02_008225 [Pyricularia oryzae]
MFRSMLGGGKRAEQQDHDLSLVSGWVDTLKQEKDKDKDVGQAGEKRGGPNASVTWWRSTANARRLWVAERSES